MTAVRRLVDRVPLHPEPLRHLRGREPLAVEQVEHLALAVGQVGDPGAEVVLGLPLPRTRPARRRPSRRAASRPPWPSTRSRGRSSSRRSRRRRGTARGRTCPRRARSRAAGRRAGRPRPPPAGRAPAPPPTPGRGTRSSRGAGCAPSPRAVACPRHRAHRASRTESLRTRPDLTRTASRGQPAEARLRSGSPAVRRRSP